MSSIDLLPPEFFLAEKRKEISKRCFETLPAHTKLSLKEGFDAAYGHGGDSLVTYLRSEGAPIWEKYVSELGKKQLGRDFSPLDENERENFRTTIADSFNQAVKRDEERKVKVSKRRFWAGGSLLAIGFGIIALTYWLIPILATSLYKQRQQEIKNSIAPELEAIKVTFGQKSDVNRELVRLSDSLSLLEGFQKNLDETKTFLLKLEQVTTLSEPAAATLTAQATDLVTIGDSVEKAVADFRAATIPEPTTAATSPKPTAAAAKSAPTTDTPVNLLTKIEKLISKTVVPQDVLENLSDWEKSRNEVLLKEQTLAEKLKVWEKHVWFEPQFAQDWSYHTALEKEAITQVFTDDPETEKLRAKYAVLTESFKDEVRNLADVKYRLAKSDKESIKELLEEVKKLGNAADSLKETVNPLVAASGELKAALATYADDASTKDLKARAVRMFDLISGASRIIADAKTGYQKIVDATEKVDKAATSLDDISELQAGLAYRGTAPAVIMLFAIGGMFVTFGLSSMLKWMKLSERAENLGENRANLLLMSQIGALLISHGLEPGPFLDRIQSSGKPMEDASTTSPQFPVSVTLAEIAKMFNGK